MSRSAPINSLVFLRLTHFITFVLMLCWYLLSSNDTLAAKLRVTATGDSITNGYGTFRLKNAFDRRGADVDTMTVAKGGFNSTSYMRSGLFDFVFATDPDVIVIKLGTNDAFANNFDIFASNLPKIYDSFQMFLNSRGNHPIVIPMTIIPVLNDETINLAIDESFNPFIRQESESRGWQVLDINSRIQEVPGWRQFYNDGIHLWQNGAIGYDWLSDQVVNELLSHYPGDADLNSHVDVRDILKVIINWQSKGGWRDGNYDGNGLINSADLIRSLIHFGAHSTGSEPSSQLTNSRRSRHSISTIPEPTSLGLLFIAFTIWFPIGRQNHLSQ